MNIKKTLLTAAATILTGTIAYGPSDAATRLKAALQGAKERVEQAVSDEQLLREAKLKLAAAEDGLLKTEAEQKLFRNRAEKAQADLAMLGDCGKVTQSRLALLAPVLKGEVAVFTLNGVNHTRAEAEAEARILLPRLEAQQQQAKFKAKELEELRRAIATNETQLGSARATLDTTKGLIAELGLKLSTAKVVAEISAKTGATQQSLNGDSGLTGTVAELQRRNAEYEVRNARHATATSQSTIAWDAAPISAAVDAAVGAKPAPATQVAPEPPKPATSRAESAPITFASIGTCGR